MTPTMVIEEARRNSIRQRFMLYSFLEEIRRGDEAKELLRKTNPEDRWISNAWFTFSSEIIPDI
jgi:hypothetical protein